MTCIFHLLYKSYIESGLIGQGPSAVRPFLNGEVLLRILDENGGVGVQAVLSHDVSLEWIVGTAERMGLAPLNTSLRSINNFFLVTKLLLMTVFCLTTLQEGRNRYRLAFQTNNPARQTAYFTTWDP
jgi:hypothetical protein